MNTWRLWPVLLIALVLAACTDAPPPAPPPEEILREAVEAMTRQTSFRFSIDRTGSPAYLDSGETISFRRAEGLYAAPDRAAAAVRLIVPGLVAEIRMIAIGDDYWETSLLTGEWAVLPTGAAFNPANLFDPAAGLPAVLETGLSGLNYAGLVELEEAPGLPLYLVSGTLDTTTLLDLTYGLIGPDPAAVELWVRPETFETYRIGITEPAASPDEEPTRWQVDFWDFGVEEAINPP